MNNSANSSITSLLGRLALAALFIPAGIQKISAYAGTQGYMEAMGISGGLLPLVILLEIGGGLALVTGMKIRWVALALAGFCFVSGILFHYQPEDQMQMTMFIKNIAIMGGLLVLAAAGAGKLSLDHFLAKS